MPDLLSPEHRSWNMSRIKGKNTQPEVILRSLLHREGYRFRLHDTKLPGRPDIVLPRHQTVILVNGCFWHRHQNCRFATTPGTRQEFWQEKFDRTVERDRRKQHELELLGWRVLTVWECDLKKSPATVVGNIKSALGGS